MKYQFTIKCKLGLICDILENKKNKNNNKYG